MGLLGHPLRHPPTLSQVSLLAGGGVSYLVHAVFIVLYAYAANKCWFTIGDPYREAIDKRADLFDDQEALDNIPIPSEFLPDFWAILTFGGVCFSHVLYFFLCFWMVDMQSLMNYHSTKTPSHGCYVKVKPLAHQGKSIITKVEQSPHTGRLHFIASRLKYEIVRNMDDDELDVKLVTTPSNLPLDTYLECRGLETEDQLEEARDIFGSNVFDIPIPTFLELYKSQLVTPIAVFQFFCAILWLLDEYWRYTMFTMFMILVFEATTAFTRMKNLSTLRGMSNKAFELAVYRQDKWTNVLTTDLLPGDLVSLRTQAETGSSGTIVPCDCLILQGHAIANESSLTGESVPQLKEALLAKDVAEGSEKLDMEGNHKHHALYSGTQLIQTVASDNNSFDITSPDGGCVCYVLRTGFSSSQGKLMRMIEFSTQQVMGNMKETAALLLLLFCFALTAAGYVFKVGLEEGKRSKYSLLLRCVQIITSVVPADLPMQAGLAINTALMTLLKAQIFCTEPFRVPFAGSITHCYFDKTGTLTTDQLEVMGAVSIRGGQADGHDGPAKLKPLPESPHALKAVIAGCHSLMLVGEQLVGDPVDSSAMKAIEWTYDAKNNRSFDVKPPKKSAEGGAPPEAVEKDAHAKRTLDIDITARNRFASALQRMSTIGIVRNRPSSTCGMDDGVYSFVKGSPEMIASLLKRDANFDADAYNQVYSDLAGRGMRVIAYAYKQLEQGGGDMEAKAHKHAQLPRQTIESDLKFAGFLAFACRLRKDSPAACQSLLESGHRVTMLTGDAPLTALHVAKEVGIVKADKKDLVLHRHNNTFEWRPVRSASGSKARPVKAGEVAELAQTSNLVVSGKDFQAMVEHMPEMWDVASHIPVYARMSPEGKQNVIKQAKDRDEKVLMCGDGGNDVGALRQAHVGLALLSGFGNANAIGNKKTEDGEEAKKDSAASAQDELAKHEKEVSAKLNDARKKGKEDMAKKKQEMMQKQQQYMEEELARLAQQGETGVWASVKATKNVVTRMKNEMQEETQKKRSEIQKKHGGAIASSAAELSKLMMDNDDNDAALPIVKLGDASIAAPFTSKMPSIRSVADIIRQGRCTLVSTVQQQQILVLNCMITAYSLSALSLEGSRNSEAQLMATGVMLMIASFAFTFAKPLDKMSPVLPLRTVFHPASIISVFGQMALHLTCMVTAVRMAKEVMGDEQLKEVIAFQKEADREFLETGDEEVFSRHKPNLLNTVVFLVETAQQVSVMAVNYKGRPWTKSVAENSALLWSLFGTCMMLVICSWEIIPELNEQLGLVQLPDDDFRFTVITLLAVSTAGTLIWDRICLAIFAPKVFKASFSESQLSLTHAASGSKKIAIGVGVVVLIAVFNVDLMTLGLIYWMYRSYKKSREAPAPAAAAAAGGNAAPASS